MLYSEYYINMSNWHPKICHDSHTPESERRSLNRVQQLSRQLLNTFLEMADLQSQPHLRVSMLSEWVQVSPQGSREHYRSL